MAKAKVNIGPCSDWRIAAEQIAEIVNDIVDSGLTGLSEGCGITISEEGVVSAAVDDETIECVGGMLHVIGGASGEYTAGAGLSESPSGTFNVVPDGVTCQINESNQLAVIAGLTFNYGMYESAPGEWSVLTDGITIAVNGSNELEVMAVPPDISQGDGIRLGSPSPIEISVNLATTNPALEFASGKLRVKVDEFGGLDRNSEGLAEKWPWRLVRGLVQGDQHPSGATIQVDNVESIHGEEPVSETTDVLVAQCQTPVWLDDNDEVFLLYSEDSGGGPAQYWSVCTALNLEALLKGLPKFDYDGDEDPESVGMAVGWGPRDERLEWFPEGTILAGTTTATVLASHETFPLGSLNVVSGLLPEGTTITVKNETVNNPGGRFSIGNGETVVVQWDARNSEWKVFPYVTGGTIRGTVRTSFSGSPTTFQVDLESVMDGFGPTSSVVTVQNWFRWSSGSAGDRVMAKRDKLGSWYAIQMEC